MWLIAVTLRRRHWQALAGTLLYNISKALAGRLGAWMESEMSGVVSSLGGLDAEQQWKYICNL